MTTTPEISVPRFFADPGSSFFLFGPRGTGKSTWLRERYPETVWLDDPLTVDGIRCLPCSDYLLGVIPGETLP